MSYEASTRLIGDMIVSSNLSKTINMHKNQRLNWLPSSGIGYLQSGSLSVYRIEDNLKIITLYSPAIIGLPFLNSGVITDYYRSEELSLLNLVPKEVALSLLTTENLWDNACYILSSHISDFYSRHVRLSETDPAHIVLECLKVINDLESIKRDSTSIYSFIMERYPLSRGTIYNVLNDLIKKKKIRMHRGRLVYLNDIT